MQQFRKHLNKMKYNADYLKTLLMKYCEAQNNLLDDKITKKSNL